MPIGKSEALTRIRAFANLPSTVVAQLAETAGLQRIGKGSAIFREGERAHFIYAIVEGGITLVNGSDETETIADFFSAGDVVLIAPVLLDLPYMATGRATTDVLVLLIPAAEFRRLAASELSLAAALNRSLSEHWRHLMRHLKQTKARDADKRLAQYLLDNVQSGDAPATFSLPGSKRELAAHLGMTPETLSRSFKRLGELGITTNGSAITVPTVSRLAVFAEGSGRDFPK